MVVFSKFNNKERSEIYCQGSFVVLQKILYCWEIYVNHVQEELLFTSVQQRLQKESVKHG